jgi:hypothetical protein
VMQVMQSGAGYAIVGRASAPRALAERRPPGLTPARSSSPSTFTSRIFSPRRGPVPGMERGSMAAKMEVSSDEAGKTVSDPITAALIGYATGSAR